MVLLLIFDYECKDIFRSRLLLRDNENTLLRVKFHFYICKRVLRSAV